MNIFKWQRKEMKKIGGKCGNEHRNWEKETIKRESIKVKNRKKIFFNVCVLKHGQI